MMEEKIAQSLGVSVFGGSQLQVQPLPPRFNFLIINLATPPIKMPSQWEITFSLPCGCISGLLVLAASGD